jgi:hypothetical protein
MKKFKKLFGFIGLAILAVLALTTNGSAADLAVSSPLLASGLGLTLKNPFESFDAERFSPDGTTSMISIQCKNYGSANADIAELFNAYKSASKVYNASLNSAVYPATYEKIALTTGTPNTITLTGRMFFDSSGNMQIYTSATNTEYIYISVLTKNLTYRQLFDFSQSSEGFTITKIQARFTTDAQIDNEISFVYNSIFGKTETQSISPRTYFSPSQYQSLLVDIPVEFYINGERGIQFTLNASETVVLNMDVRRGK